MEVGLILTSVFALLVIVTIFLGVTIVPQGTKNVVQRLGKFHKVLGPGLHIIVPYIDTVAYKVPTKDLVLDIPSQEVITKDNAVIVANAVAFINVMEPEKAVYGVSDYALAIRNLVQTSLRSIVGEMALDDALSSRDLIKSKLKSAISDDIADWGIIMKTVEIQDINPSPTMQASMEEQAAAERRRRARVAMAEGEKQAAILEADGKYEASKREAAAKKVLADADKEAIRMIAEGLQNEAMPGMFLLGNRYINAMSELAQSDNSKMVVLPADFQKAVQGLFSKG